MHVLGDVDISTITTAALKTYLPYSRTKKILKASSIGHRVRFLHGFFRYALESGYIKANPAISIKEPKVGKRVPKALPEEGSELLREGCKGTLDHALLEFFNSTGCRIGEVHRANWKDIDWNDRSLIVLGKGDKERQVFLTIKAVIWVRKYLKERLERGDNVDALFVTERKPYRRSSIPQLRYVVNRIASKSEVQEKVTPHILRHGYATKLINEGASLYEVQSLLGHQDPKATMIYVSLSGARMREVHRKFMR